MMFYIGLGVLVLVVDVVRTIYMFYYSMRISRNIHTKMFACIVEAPIKFFDDNPSGMCIIVGKYSYIHNILTFLMISFIGNLIQVGKFIGNYIKTVAFLRMSQMQGMTWHEIYSCR